MWHLGRGRRPMVCKTEKGCLCLHPKEIVAHTDWVSLWALVAMAEALNHAGITDLYELYQNIHPFEVGTSLGSGMGGMTNLAQMFKDCQDEKEVQSNILQEMLVFHSHYWASLMLYRAVSSIPLWGGLTCCCCPWVDQSRFQLALGEQQKVSYFVNILKYGCSATALQSMEIASETILTGKMKVMITGGFNDLCEEGSYEFSIQWARKVLQCLAVLD